MSVLESLEPKKVFTYFEDLCSIPHPSHSTKAVSDYCVQFAKDHSLEWYQDSLNNVIIRKPASAGCEQAPAVILQGHLDMVAEKAPDCYIDFSRDGLDLAVENGYVFARGTTLGGDDGIAVAMALAVLDSDDLVHPALEAVFTVDEETGMDGAMEIDGSQIHGRLMLNLDSEEEGILTVACAGGACARVRIPLSQELCTLKAYTLSVSGLTGGHSGGEINRGRANADILLGRCLSALQGASNLRIVRCAGGTKDNAIPNAAEAVVALSDDDVDAANGALAVMQGLFSSEYAAADPGITLSLVPAAAEDFCFDAPSTGKIISYLLLAPNGIFEMSQDIPGLVQTSCNLGILHIEGDGISAITSVRSSVPSQKAMILDRIRELASVLGGSVRVTGEYPAWEYRRVSPLRDLVTQTFEDLYGKPMKVEAIHAGLECGLFSGKLAGLDAVSFGPDLQDIHTCRERMDIASVQRVWTFLCEVLRRLSV